MLPSSSLRLVKFVSIGSVDTKFPQERFGEVGAGVGMGMLPLFGPSSTYRHYKGPNGLYVMRELGILDAVLAIASEPSKRLFSFISGVGDHQEIFDVRELLSFSLYGFNQFLNSMRNQLDLKLVKELQCIGMAPPSPRPSLFHVLMPI